MGGQLAEFAPASVDAERGRLTLAGEIDIAQVEMVLTEAHACLEGPAPVLEVDLADVTFIDSSGLGALVQIRTAARDRGKSMELHRVPPSVVRLLEVTGLTAVFPAVVDG
jgi:anti-anti-sigma factor